MQASNHDPEKWPLTIKAGDSWPPEPFRVVDESNAPISLEGATILQQIKVKASDSAAVKTLTTADFEITGSTARYKATVVNDLSAGVYVSDIEITLANGMTKTIFDRTITITPDVSRP